MNIGQEIINEAKGTKFKVGDKVVFKPTMMDKLAAASAGVPEGATGTVTKGEFGDIYTDPKKKLVSVEWEVGGKKIRYGVTAASLEASKEEACKGKKKARAKGLEWLDDYEAMRAELDEGGGYGPTTLTFGMFAKDWAGAILMDVQGDMKLGDFYNGLMDYAKKCGLPSVPIEKVMGSFNYGSSGKTYLFFEVRYENEDDVIETMQKASQSRCGVWMMTPEKASKKVLDAAKEIKAKIGRKGGGGKVDPGTGDVPWGAD